MIIFLQFIFSFLILLIITPQTAESNKVLKVFHESGLFAFYGEAKSFLFFLTWFLIFLFFFISLL